MHESSYDIRFIAYVCDRGPLGVAEIAKRVGSEKKARSILEWATDSRYSEAKRRYLINQPNPDTVDVRSTDTWKPEREEILKRHGYGHALASYSAPVPDRTPLEVLRTFVSVLCGELDRTTDDMLRFLWGLDVDNSARTFFYRHNLWPRLAGHWPHPKPSERRTWVKLENEYGEDRIDQALLTPDGIPLMLIESENDSNSILNSELPKLCKHDAPLNVILTCCEWEGHPEIPQTREKALLYREYQAQWKQFISDFRPRPGGIYCFIVAEGYTPLWTDSSDCCFRFNAFAFDGSQNAAQINVDALPNVLHCRRLPPEDSVSYYVTAFPVTL